ncbi:MAG: GFA family protein [Candidatus Aminicenantes bacterium]|nr:MAG: GFA family protein [Candidatus Aminicenantes bacterium]
MANTTKRIGICLCGAVRITAHHAQNRVGACHCSMCRTWGGGPLMAVNCGTEVEIEGEEHVKVFDSSEWAERGFCSKCGTNLFYRLKQHQAFYMAAGIFTDHSGLIFDHQVFIDEKPDYYEFANETHNMTGAEVFARFNSSS